MAVFRNLLTHPFRIGGDWHAASVEVILPTSTGNITTIECSIYTPQAPSKTFAKPDTRSSISRETWRQCKSPFGQKQNKIGDNLQILDKKFPFYKPFSLSSLFDRRQVAAVSKTKFCVSFIARSVLNALRFEGELDQHRNGKHFVGNYKRSGKRSQAVLNDHRPDLTAGTKLLFAEMSIIEGQHVAGVKST